MVKAGEEMAVIDPRPYQAALAQAQAKRAQDEAQLANAKRDLERNLGLRDFASRQQVDTQRALVAQWEAQVKADQAAIDSAQVQLSYTTITAPISGRIGLRSIDQGNMVRAADATGLASISQIQPISIVFTLPEKDLPPVLEAQAAGPVTVVALDRDGKKPLGEGRLAVIDNQIDANTGTIRLKATLPNDPPRLWPGQFVNVRLLAATRRDATVIPAPAVQRGPQGTFVYVIKPDQTAEHRPVTVGPIEDGKALIEAGLTPGERIVVDGQYKLQAGAQVRIGEATPPPESQPQQRRDRKRDKS
jgi:multidrug efflux system membrane fusion protein